MTLAQSYCCGVYKTVLFVDLSSLSTQTDSVHQIIANYQLSPGIQKNDNKLLPNDGFGLTAGKIHQ